MNPQHLPKSPRIEVVITGKIIDDSKERDSSHCMIAEAVRAAFPDARRVAVDLQTIRLTDPVRGLRYTYLTPRIAQEALIRFDQGEFPGAFRFRLQRGQVTRAGSNSIRPDQRQREDRSPAQIEALKKNREKLKTAHIRDSHGNVPDIVGGTTPPVMPWGRRRAFGLRGLTI